MWELRSKKEFISCKRALDMHPTQMLMYSYIHSLPIKPSLKQKWSVRDMCTEVLGPDHGQVSGGTKQTFDFNKVCQQSHKSELPQWTCKRELNRGNLRLLALFHCMVRHGTVRYGSLLGGFPLRTVPSTWYFFSTTSVEVPCKQYRYQNVTCKLCWSPIGRRKSPLLRHWTCDTRPSSTALPARFKSAQPAKDRTQLLFKQTHIFESTTK